MDWPEEEEEEEEEEDDDEKARGDLEGEFGRKGANITNLWTNEEGKLRSVGGFGVSELKQR